MRTHPFRTATLAATAAAALTVPACETPLPPGPVLQTVSAECLGGGQIRQAVAAGSMTAEEGRALYAKCNQDATRAAADGGGLRGRLGQAVRQGWITREQAGEIFEELGVEGRRLRQAIADGELTPEEARGTHLRLEFRALGTRLREGVAADDMTAEDARAAIGAYRSLMGGNRNAADTRR